MKYLLIILLCFAITKTFAQKINFTIKDGKIDTKQELVKLKLPLDLNFNKINFYGKTIEILNDSNKVIALKEGKFGQSGLQALDGESDITIQILKDGTVNPTSKGDMKIKDMKNIYLRIEGFDPIVLSFDKTSEGETLEEAYQPGYIYYDAIKLMSLGDEYGSIKQILASYGINSNNYKDNLYIKDVFGDVLKEGGDQAGGSLLTNLGNKDVTYFAAGLARFLAERTKEELNEAFFSKMKEQLNAYPELKTLFPKTTSFLNIIETYSYASIIQVLKEAFETDIQNLPVNLYEIKNLSKKKCDGINDKDLKKKCDDRMQMISDFFNSQLGHWVALGMFTVKEGFQSTNPADFLKTVVASSEFTELKSFSSDSSKFNDYNIASSIELSNFISQSLISKEDNKVWISLDQLNSLFKTKDAFKVYLGLLLSFEARDGDKIIIDFYKTDNGKISFGEILRKAHKDYTKLEPQVIRLIKNTHAAYNATNNAVKKMEAAIEKSIQADPQALYDYYRTLTLSLKPIAHDPLLIALVGKDIGAAYDKVEQFLNPSVDIAYHISTKMYSAAIYDASILLNSLNDHKIITRDKKGKTKEENYNEFKTVTNSFVKYGTLISSVANAQSSDEVKQAIEASVLPVGSSSIKRKSAWSISVNGYVGGFYGKAHSISADTVLNKSKNKLDTITTKVSYRTFGLYAPIGISFNRGFKCGWGVSFTAQVLDLGALVDFYLTEGDQAALPNDFKVKLSDILSPGIQLAINFPKTPLTLMGGIQYVPALSNKSQIVSNTLSPMAWRGQVALLVDIPMYNLKVWDFKR